MAFPPCEVVVRGRVEGMCFPFDLRMSPYVSLRGEVQVRPTVCAVG